MKKNKYDVDDILLITAWDQGDEKWQTGIIQITNYEPISSHTEYGVYETKHLAGNIHWLCINAQILDDTPDVRILGNIGIDKGWKVLYGGKQSTKQRT